MTIGAGTVVDPLPLAPPRISLLTSAIVDESSRGAQEWLNGLELAPEACTGPENPYWWECPGESGQTPEQVYGSNGKLIPNPPAIVRFRPFTVWTGFRCSTAQFRSNDYEGRAKRALEAFQSTFIEEELWTGARVAVPANLPNDYFQNSPTALNSGSATPYVTALAELEQALAECNPGQPGMIHAQPRLVTLWLQNGLVAAEPNGRRLRTTFGTIVVPGSGYPGSGAGLAAGTVAESYAYGTGMIRVWLGPVSNVSAQETSSGDNNVPLGDSDVVRATNDVRVRVEREAAALWDECCQVSVRVDHTSATT